MKLRGEATLVFRDIETGEITKEVTESNYVTEDQINRMVDGAYRLTTSFGYGGDPKGRFGQYIWLGGLDQEHERTWNQMWKVQAQGTIETGVTSPAFLNGTVGTGSTFAYYYQYQNRFAPPAADRTIQMIAINRDDYTSIPNYHSPLYVSAYVVLTTPCVQTTTETLDVFYRIIWDNPEQDTSVYVPSQGMMYRIARRHMFGITEFAYYPFNSAFCLHGRKHITNSRNQVMSMGLRGYGTDVGNPPLYDTMGGNAYADYSYRTRIMQLTGGLSQALGLVVGSAYHYGRSNVSDTAHMSMFWNPTVPAAVSPIQNVFSHSSAATGPFYDAGTIPTSDGTLTINGDSWTDPDWQKLLRIQITGTGAVGTGTYKVWMRNISGFINNTYADSVAAIPFINNSNNYYSIMFDNSVADTGGTPVRIWYGRSYTERTGVQAMDYDGKSKFIGWNQETLFKFDAVTNERTAFRTDTTPAMPRITPGDSGDISQVCVADNGDIWVADAINGLMRIHADNSAIDHFTNAHADLTGIGNSECFGVTKTPGRIWAIMNDSLIYTTDNGVSFTVYDSTTTPAFNIAPGGQERRYWFLQGDPTHADHRLAVGYNETGTYSNIGRYCQLRITWWDSISGQGNNTPYLMYGTASTILTSTQPQRRRELFQFFQCSPTTNVWAARGSYNVPGPGNYDPGLWNYNTTTPAFTYTPGSNDTAVNAFMVWWVTDVNGNEGFMTVQRQSSNNVRYAIHKQDGTTDISANVSQYIDATTSPIHSTQMISAWSSAGTTKVVFRDTGMLLFGGRDGSATGGEYSWYCVPVSDNVSSDAGNFKNVTWDEYGWNGTAWVKDNPGSKTIHASTDAIVDGLTISFDDASGTQTFVDTDYYTTGVIDGILMDGGTEFDTRYALYYKPVDFNRTEIEGGGTLPATTSDASRGLNETEISTMIDNFNTTYDATYNRFARTSSGAFGFRMYGAMPKQAYYQCRVLNLSSGERQVVGMANASKIGASPSENDIDYAVRVTSDSNNNWKIEVISNGVVVHTEYDPPGSLASYDGEFNYQNGTDSYIRFDRNDETVGDLEVRVRNKIIYTFTGVTQSLIPSVWSSGFSYHYWSSMSTSYTDYHVDLGNSTLQVGQFDPNFWAIDGTVAGIPDLTEIKIDGVPVTVRLVNDYGRTTLAAGEVELLTYQGKIRFSVADVGKTLTIDRYNVILHE